jgi:hypothetical protein
LNLLFGRVTGEVEYAFAGPFSVALLPEYVFNQPIDNRPDGITAKGGGIAAQFGFWVEGRPLRGYFLKAHTGYRSITVTGPYDEIAVPATEIGAMFGSQSVYGGWFTLSGGFGVVYDLQSQDRPFKVGPPGTPVGVIRASGVFGNGFDLLGQLSIGGSF